ncbi:MAG: HAD-IB family phosphatase [Oscillospiraceae bacterium]|nr:HAD-IB family phosphatase [Oscillospiraceae bacterium]
MPNVYDFDKTVIYPDSTAAFFRFCMKRHRRLARYVPGQLAAWARYHWHVSRGVHAKGEFYAFVRALPDWREEVRLFWEENASAMLKPWYLAQKKPDDIIISASPEFLLGPLCENLGVRLIATRVDLKKGRIAGINCHTEEKVRRLREAFGDVKIDSFYSDSLSDAPLAALAGRAWLVKGDRIIPWPK